MEGDVFPALMAWSAADPAQERHWKIGQFMRTSYHCHLSWKCGEPKVTNLNKHAPTPQEAVRLVLEEFARRNATTPG